MPLRSVTSSRSCRGPAPARVPRLRLRGRRRPERHRHDQAAAHGRQGAQAQDAIDADPTHGTLGIAHTRWATHGVPSERNAHPHISRDGIAIVHNGIIENHDELRADCSSRPATSSPPRPTPRSSPTASTTTCRRGDLFKAVRATVAELEGAYALAVMSQDEPDRIVLAREGLPRRRRPGRGRELRRLGRGRAAARDAQFIILEEGDVAEIRRKAFASSTTTATRCSARSTRASCRRMRRRRASTRTTCSRRSTSSRARSRRRSQERVAGGKLLEAAFGPPRPPCSRDRGRAHRGLRHQLPRRRGREVLHRADLPAALLGRDRQRIPLPQSGRSEEHAVRERLAVGRDGRHAGGAAPRQAGGLPVARSRSATCPRARWCASRSS